MKLIRKSGLTHENRSFEICVYDDGSRYQVAGFEKGKKKTVTYEVDHITNADLLALVPNFCPYESLVGLVARDITRGYIEK